MFVAVARALAFTPPLTHCRILPGPPATVGRSARSIDVETCTLTQVGSDCSYIRWDGAIGRFRFQGMKPRTDALDIPQRPVFTATR